MSPVFPELSVGDEFRIDPDYRPRNRWRVIGRDDRHVVAVRQAPFEAKGTLEYTILGSAHVSYNGVGPGPVRSSLNTLGGGYRIQDREPEAAAEMLEGLRSGRWRLSPRRWVPVREVETLAQVS